MYKLFSPKWYLFTGILLGMPTVLYASYCNGKALKETHPNILETTKGYIRVFAILLTVYLGFAIFQTDLLPSAYVATVDARVFVKNVKMVFLIVQFIMLIVFLTKGKKKEEQVYDELQKNKQVTDQPIWKSLVFMIVYQLALVVIVFGSTAVMILGRR